MVTTIKAFFKVIGVLFCIGLIILSLVFSINTKITLSSQLRIYDDFSSLSDYDCVLILGAGVKADGSPTLMLADRLERGVELYNAGVSDVLFMTGDSVKPEYDETSAMVDFAEERDVPSGDIMVDRYGISTYDSLFRAKEYYGYEKIVIVTQRYHMYRALYLADALGIDAVGVCARDVRYTGQILRDVRELFANVKALGSTAMKPSPAYMD